MKSIHYDSEGDILTITFVKDRAQPRRGVELSDNIVLYFNPKTHEPVELILISYQAMLQASAQKPLRLPGLQTLSPSARNTVLRIMRRPPIANFLRLETGTRVPSSYPANVFTSDVLRAVT